MLLNDSLIRCTAEQMDFNHHHHMHHFHPLPHHLVCLLFSQDINGGFGMMSPSKHSDSRLQVSKYSGCQDATGQVSESKYKVHADLCCSGELLVHLSPPWLSPLVKRVNEAREIKAKKCSGTNPGVQEETLFVQSNKSIISRDERRQGDIEENKESSLPSPTTKC